MRGRQATTSDGPSTSGGDQDGAPEVWHSCRSECPACLYLTEVVPAPGCNGADFSAFAYVRIGVCFAQTISIAHNH